jgi:hypothetical protein
MCLTRSEHLGRINRIDDFGEYPNGDHKPYPRQKPARNNRANNPNDDIADNTEPVALDQKAGEPARNAANNEPNDQVYKDGSFFI